MRENIAILLNELPRSVPNFTVHDISHVDALWETATLICGDAVTLNPAEAYVLGCAFAFHDAAMGLAAYTDDIAEVMGRSAWCDLVSTTFFEATGRWPDAAEMDDLPENIYHACVAEAVRQTHPERAATLVEQPWRLNSGNDLQLIGDTQLRESYSPIVGELASSHWWNVDKVARRFRHPKGSLPWQPTSWTIDALKLACILRLADATQIDSRRAPSFLFALRDPKGASRDHWRFQEHMGRPQLVDDRISYSSMRPFEKKDATAWWLALDYLQQVDRELKRVDSLLHDLGKPRLAAKAIAHVDRPERFAEIFPVNGWRPVDADVQISDVRGLIMALGGEQLYGRVPDVAVRELIQNAQDAVLARQAIDPAFRDGQVVVSLEHHDDDWFLEVSDNGIGMDEDIIVHGLLDFGCSGWRTDTIRSKFVGLASGGFRPRGTFGVGFYSVFMLGDDVSVTTRRFDAGLPDARHLQFNGLENRPILSTLPPDARVGPGTTVRGCLKTDPVAEGGLLHKTSDDEIGELVQSLVPDSAVPVATLERYGTRRYLLQPFDLTTANPEEVFDRLYPLRSHSFWMDRVEHAELRDEFTAQATKVTGDDGQELGLAMLRRDPLLWHFRTNGVVVVNGFRADDHPFYTGYFVGEPSRASRDNVELACTPDQFKAWLASQERRLRERERFSTSVQLELSYLMHRVMGRLQEDHCMAMNAEGLVRVGDIAGWARERDQISLLASYAWPLQWSTRPPELRHRSLATTIRLPPGCLAVCALVWSPFLDSMFPKRHDSNYGEHRHERRLTWQKMWWQNSEDIEGLVIKQICRAWSCEPGDVLAPVAERNWDDYADLGIPGVAPAPVLHLRRP